MRQPTVYIVTNQINGTLYIGVTSNLIKRIWEHKNSLVDGFTKQYGLHLLVYFEVFSKMLPAIQREKHLKKWNRDWKIRLIEEKNPTWSDLYPLLVAEKPIPDGFSDGFPPSRE